MKADLNELVCCKACGLVYCCDGLKMTKDNEYSNDFKWKCRCGKENLELI